MSINNVEIILRESVAGLGKVGDAVTVKAGHAFNFLIPQSKAILMTEENKQQFEKERVELEKKAAEQRKTAEEQAKSVKKLVLEHTVKTSADGKLFGSVTVRDVIAILEAKEINVSKQNIKLVGGNIHHAGDYQVELTFYADVVALVDLKIISNHPEYQPEAELEQVVTEEEAAPSEQASETAEDAAAEDASLDSEEDSKPE